MISLTCIDETSTFFSTFNSNARKVVRIPGKGIAFSRITERNAAYSAQRQKIDLYDEAFCHVASLYEGVAASQAPVLQLSARGELFAIWNDWSTTPGTITVIKWPDVCTSPVVKPPLPCGPAGGKFSAIWDDAKRTLFFANNQNGLFRFGPNGDFLSGSIYSNPAPNAPLEYPYLLPLNEDGALEMAWTNNDLPGPINYRSIQYARSPDGGLSWAATANAAPQVNPILSTAGLRIDQAEETPGYKWLMAAHSEGDFVHFMYDYNANRSEQVFTNPENSVLQYVRIDRRTGAVTRRLRPFRTESVPVGAIGGLFARRGSKLYFVTTVYDGPAVVAFVSDDDGDTWREHASLTVPHSAPITLYALGGDPGHPWDPDIIGCFTVAHGTGEQVMADIDIPASTYLFRICL
jgi:hypothetical protein